MVFVELVLVYRVYFCRLSSEELLDSDGILECCLTRNDASDDEGGDADGTIDVLSHDILFRSFVRKIKKENT